MPKNEAGSGVRAMLRMLMEAAGRCNQPTRFMFHPFSQNPERGTDAFLGSRLCESICVVAPGNVFVMCLSGIGIAHADFAGMPLRILS